MNHETREEQEAKEEATCRADISCSQPVVVVSNPRFRTELSIVDTETP